MQWAKLAFPNTCTCTEFKPSAKQKKYTDSKTSRNVLMYCTVNFHTSYRFLCFTVNFPFLKFFFPPPFSFPRPKGRELLSRLLFRQSFPSVMRCRDISHFNCFASIKTTGYLVIIRRFLKSTHSRVVLM